MKKNDDKFIKRMKVLIVVFGVLSLFNIILLVNNKSYALFRRTVSSKRIVEIHTAKEFPQKRGIAIDIVKKTLGKEGGIIGVTTDNTMAKDKEVSNIREYRYSGSEVNNYVYFNCSDSTSEQNEDNCEIWRIIGIFKDENGVEHIKLVINSTSNKMEWNDSQSWASSSINTFLNGSYLTSLTSEAQNMIESTKWYLGKVTQDDTTVNLYAQERNGSTWPGKIALMYPSDYGYSVDSSYWTTKTGDSGFTSTIAETSWLYKTANHSSVEWLLSPSDGGSYGVARWQYGGSVSPIYSVRGDTVRPSLYLKSDIQIIGGKGTLAVPYALSVE